MTQNLCLQRGDIGFGIGHDVMHPCDAIRRFGRRTVKDKAQIRQPSQCVCRLRQKEAPQRIVVAGFDVAGRKLANIFDMRIQAVVDVGTLLKTGAVRRERSDGNPRCTAESMLFFQDND